MRKAALNNALLIVASLLPVVAMPQAPVEDSRPRQDTIMQSQQRASAAYRDLQSAEQARRLAEQDAQRAEMQYKDAQKRADELKRQFDNANGQLNAAKTKEAQAKIQYDAALNAVDQSFGKAPPK